MENALDEYRIMCPISDLIDILKSTGTSSWCSTEFQDQVIEKLIRDPICEMYPPEKKYTLRLLKSYIREIENNGSTVADELAKELVVHIQSESDLEDLYYKTYRLNNQDIVTVRVSGSFREVGLKLWEAAFYMAEFVMSNKHLFKGRKVLELGAGVGLTGLILAKYCEPSLVTLSDYSAKVIANLSYNIDINRTFLKGVDHPPQTLMVDWSDFNCNDAASLNPDVLVACDCVYDIDAFPALMKTLNVFFTFSRSTANRRVAYFAATLRNEATFSAFLSYLEHYDIDFMDITQDSGESHFYYSNRESIRLCRLTSTIN